MIIQTLLCCIFSLCDLLSSHDSISTSFYNHVTWWYWSFVWFVTNKERTIVIIGWSVMEGQNYSNYHDWVLLNYYQMLTISEKLYCSVNDTGWYILKEYSCTGMKSRQVSQLTLPSWNLTIYMYEKPYHHDGYFKVGVNSIDISYHIWPPLCQDVKRFFTVILLRKNVAVVISSICEKFVVILV